MEPIMGTIAMNARSVYTLPYLQQWTCGHHLHWVLRHGPDTAGLSCYVASAALNYFWGVMTS